MGRLDPDELGEEDEACLVAATTLGERAAMLARFIEAAGKGAPAGRATMNSRLGGRFVGIEGVVELDEPDRKIRIRSSALDP